MAVQGWRETLNDIEKVSLELPEHFSGRSVDVVQQMVLLRARDEAEDRLHYWQRELGKIDHRLKLFEDKGAE